MKLLPPYLLSLPDIIMMFNFFKRTKKHPPFPRLQHSDKRDSYFRRTASWDWLNPEQIWITDPKGPRVLTLDPWPQAVFIAADGQRTISEYIHLVADKYNGTIPEALDSTILHELDTLIRYGIIEWLEASERPAPLHDLPGKYRNKAN